MVTVVESLIASSGGDYATPNLWESDTDDNLTSLDTQHDGLLANETWTSSVTFAGATTDSTRYRRLKPEGSYYDPIADDGPKIIASSMWSGTVDIVESFTVVQGIYLRNTLDATSGNSHSYRVYGASSTDNRVEGCVFQAGSAGNTNGVRDSAAAIRGIRNKVLNCLVLPYLGPTVTSFAGISVSSFDSSTAGDENWIINCTSIGVLRGFTYNQGTGYVTIKMHNNIAIGNTLGGFVRYGNDIGSGDATYNLTDYATLPLNFTSGYTSQVATDIFEDYSGGDYRPKSTGNAYGSGYDFSSIFTTDITGSTRANWSIGAYDAPPTPAGTPPDDPTGLAVSDAVANELTLTWTDNATDEDNYVVERSPNGTDTWTVLTSTLPADTVTYTDDGLSATDTWYYRVKATNAYGDSAYTSVVSGTVTGSAATATIEKNFATTEYIPAHFSFSGWASTPGSGGLKDCAFEWVVSGGSEHDGTYTGPNLGLVFETAGTFTVTLNLTDEAGNTDSDSTTVTVATPTYDNVIYVSAAGSDSNDGLTDAAPKLTFDAGLAALKTAHGAGEHSCLYLRKGDSFTCGTTVSGKANSTGTFYLRSYGSGDNPTVTASSVQLLSQTNNASQHITWKIADVDFEQTGSNGIFDFDHHDTSGDDRGYDATFARCDIYMSGTGFGCLTFGAVYDSQSITTYRSIWPGYTRCGNIALMDCDVTTDERYGLYGEVNWITILRGSVKKPVGTQGEHPIRLQYASKASIRGVDLESTWDSTTQLRFGCGVYNWTSTYRLSSHENTVEGCSFVTGNYLALQMCYEGADAENLLVAPGRQIALNNKFTQHPTEPYSGTWTAVEAYGRDVAIVGNTFIGNCSPIRLEGSRGTTITDEEFEVLIANNSFVNTEASNRYLLTLDSAYPVTVSLVNNALSGTASAGLINGSSTTGELERITSDHNVADVTTWAANVGSAGTRTLAQWQTASGQDANSAAADPEFTDPANDDWSIATDSPCYNAGQTVYASWLTRAGTERTGTWDVGAFEFIPSIGPGGRAKRRRKIIASTLNR